MFNAKIDVCFETPSIMNLLKVANAAAISRPQPARQKGLRFFANDVELFPACILFFDEAWVQLCSFAFRAENSIHTPSYRRGKLHDVC